MNPKDPEKHISHLEHQLAEARAAGRERGGDVDEHTKRDRLENSENHVTSYARCDY